MVVNAFTKYSEILQEAWQPPEIARRVSDSYAEYLRTVREAFAAEDSRRRLLDAYQRYVGDLQQAWAQIDVAVVAPQDLARIAEGIAWVAGVATEVGRLQAGSGEVGRQNFPDERIA